MRRKSSGSRGPALAIADRGGGCELTREEWDGAQGVLNTSLSEFTKLSKQIKLLLQDESLTPKDHLHAKLSLKCK